MVKKLTNKFQRGMIDTVVERVKDIAANADLYDAGHNATASSLDSGMPNCLRSLYVSISKLMPTTMSMTMHFLTYNVQLVKLN
ncbi:hypothetical protein MMYC01_205402 [Madurella mycetomatis]|uniref:Uncharacterized protein n=1 Tax=Madurella mycetomatis TaxID=100816 RepID=A0A175W067_9PEZI|nr:hypothetical protein MMYC01_205402 [Madurella mycetomatis]